MSEPTREEMDWAVRQAIGRLCVDRANGKLSIGEYSKELSAVYGVRRELEAGGWPPPILVGRLRADRSTYYICPERPGFHFITGEGESTDDLLKAFREFCVLYDAANSAPPATSDGGEG